MNLYDATIEKMRELPEPLVQEVSNFIDFLTLRHHHSRWHLWLLFTEELELTTLDFAAYLPSLEAYEELLAREELQW